MSVKKKTRTRSGFEMKMEELYFAVLSVEEFFAERLYAAQFPLQFAVVIAKMKAMMRQMWEKAKEARKALQSEKIKGGRMKGLKEDEATLELQKQKEH